MTNEKEFIVHQASKLSKIVSLFFCSIFIFGILLDSVHADVTSAGYRCTNQSGNPCRANGNQGTFQCTSSGVQQGQCSNKSRYSCNCVTSFIAPCSTANACAPAVTVPAGYYCAKTCTLVTSTSSVTNYTYGCSSPTTICTATAPIAPCKTANSCGPVVQPSAGQYCSNYCTPVTSNSTVTDNTYGCTTGTPICTAAAKVGNCTSYNTCTGYITVPDSNGCGCATGEGSTCTVVRNFGYTSGAATYGCKTGPTWCMKAATPTPCAAETCSGATPKPANGYTCPAANTCQPTVQSATATNCQYSCVNSGDPVCKSNWVAPCQTPTVQCTAVTPSSTQYCAAYCTPVVLCQSQPQVCSTAATIGNCLSLNSCGGATALASSTNSNGCTCAANGSCTIVTNGAKSGNNSTYPCETGSTVCTQFNTPQSCTITTCSGSVAPSGTTGWTCPSGSCQPTKPGSVANCKISCVADGAPKCTAEWVPPANQGWQKAPCTAPYPENTTANSTYASCSPWQSVTSYDGTNYTEESSVNGWNQCSATTVTVYICYP